MAETNKGRSEEEVARAFVNHYYHLFDNDRSSLSTLYNPTSLLTFEGQKIYGVEDISNKLKQLPFDQCRHLISTVDSQPSSMAGGCGGILVFVSGSIQLHGEDRPLRCDGVGVGCEGAGNGGVAEIAVEGVGGDDGSVRSLGGGVKRS
ncbi:nuclear transport factor 2B [Raphanus sativus]|uniref:NTF2-related export protein n=1 Tax=Raphanus sativus TaxID=3726 RepID=A0A9W3CA17_RAPSA|nr:nuclear transport factor 2B [Raphanus sativus]